MGRPSKFQIMELYKIEIMDALQSQGRSVFTEEQIHDLLELNKENWKLPKSADANDLLFFLAKAKQIFPIRLEFPRKIVTRYILSHHNLSLFELACSIAKNAYVSHYSAAFFHDLTDNIVKTFFVNQEQKPKAIEDQSDDPELQERIRNAFSRPMRISNNIAIFDQRKFYLLNGKFTNNLGVIDHGNFKVTNIERTLIDIAVRPDYAGGPFEVLDIYKNAKGAASINKLYSYLKKLNHMYPYHQVIGFYLEKAGYKENVLRLMEKFPITYDFYLTYDMKNTKYSDRWKLFYPIELELTRLESGL